MWEELRLLGYHLSECCSGALVQCRAAHARHAGPPMHAMQGRPCTPCSAWGGVASACAARACRPCMGGGVASARAASACRRGSTPLVWPHSTTCGELAE